MDFKFEKIGYADEGYSWMEQKTDQGYQAIAQIGEWPYCIFMKKKMGGNVEILNYMEGEVSKLVIKCGAEYREFLMKQQSSEECRHD